MTPSGPVHIWMLSGQRSRSVSAWPVTKYVARVVVAASCTVQVVVAAELGRDLGVR